MGKGTEVGKHETCVEINEEPGLSGKKGLCQGVVDDEVGWWAGMLHFPGWVSGHSSSPCRRAGERAGQQRGLLCDPWRDGGGWTGGCGHLLELLQESPLMSSRVMQLGVEGRAKNVIFVYGQTHRHTHINLKDFFSICQEPEKG